MPKETSEIRSCPDQNGRPAIALSCVRKPVTFSIVSGCCAPSVVRCDGGETSCPGIGCRRTKAKIAMLKQRACRARHHTAHDSKTQIRRISFVLPQEGRLNRQAPQPWHICNPGKGQATRARGSVFQKTLRTNVR